MHSADPHVSACSLTEQGSSPECSQRLILSECLDRSRAEAEHGVVDTGNYRCRYFAWGEGPPLVCIPGLASSAISFVMLMARLRTQFRCVSYDLPDGGRDGAHLAAYRHEDLLADLFALLDHLRLRESFLLGFSFGSTMALSALYRQPRRFSRAILQGGFARRALTATEVFAAHWCRFLPGRLGQVPLMRQVLERNHRAPFRTRDAEVWDFFLAQQRDLPLRAFASRVLMLPRLDLRPILPAIPHAVLMVCGDHDPLVNQHCEQELKQGLPSVARAEIEQCGHQPHLTHPEVLAEITRQFLLPSACA